MAANTGAASNPRALTGCAFLCENEPLTRCASETPYAMCSSSNFRAATAAVLLISISTLFAALPGQPFASYWHPNTLLTWNPANDPDAPFNRANTPLAPRVSNPALNVNPNARTNQARIASLSL